MAELIGDIARGAVENALRAASDESDAFFKICDALRDIGLGTSDVRVFWGGIHHTASVLVTRPGAEPFRLEAAVPDKDPSRGAR